MSDKNTTLKKTLVKKTTPEIVLLIEKKLVFFQDVIQNTILHVQKNKVLDIINVSELNSCINLLTDLSKKLKDIGDITIGKYTSISGGGTITV